MSSIELTEQQQRQLAVASEQPPRVVDPTTKNVYVLLRAEEYESIRDMLEEGRERSAIHAVALRNAVGRMDETP